MFRLNDRVRVAKIYDPHTGVKIGDEGVIVEMYDGEGFDDQCAVYFSEKAFVLPMSYDELEVVK